MADECPKCDGTGSQCNACDAGIMDCNCGPDAEPGPCEACGGAGFTAAVAERVPGGVGASETRFANPGIDRPTRSPRTPSRGGAADRETSGRNGG